MLVRDRINKINNKKIKKYKIKKKEMTICTT